MHFQTACETPLWGRAQALFDGCCSYLDSRVIVFIKASKRSHILLTAFLWLVNIYKNSKYKYFY